MTKRMLASPVYLAIATALLAAPALAQTPATPATPSTPPPASSTPAPATPAPADTTAAPATSAPAAGMSSMPGMSHTGTKSAAGRAARIEKLQTALNANGAQLTVDGKMGAQTKAALMDFQKSKGLKVTGKVDKETIAALKPAG
jgi:peptidoglycan hydrolase-like protein with peptidoglycan-binding domain